MSDELSNDGLRGKPLDKEVPAAESQKVSVAESASSGEPAAKSTPQGSVERSAEGDGSVLRESSARAAGLDVAADAESQPRRRTPLIVGVCVAVVAILVVAALAFGGVFGAADSQGNAGQATQEQQAEATADGESAEQSEEGSEESQDAEGEDGDDSESDADSSEGDGNSSSSKSASSGSASGSSAGSSSNASSGSSGTSGGSSGGSSSSQQAAPAPQPSTITVSVSIDSSRAASYGYPSSMGGGTVTLQQGASVYDALRAVGVSVGGSSSYVSSIGGLAEFACGQGSGWLYSVNGSFPGISCGSYKLSGGERIVWIYTLDYGNDL